MKSIDWQRKLSSRKFWAGLVSFVTALMAAFNIDKIAGEQVTLIVTGIGALAVYMLSEGIADQANAQQKK